MKTNKGQALVETALIAPLLIFLLIGVFETGYALRSYLVLANASREAARFAVRPGYLTYDEAGYNRVVSHTLNSISGQIPFTQGGTVIVSVISIETQRVCDPDDLAACNCGVAMLHPISPTLVMSPLNVPTLTYKYPATSTEQTWLDYASLTANGVLENRRFNCQLQKRGAVPAVDTMVTVELFYDHPQLFGFPLISNPLTDPIKMHGHTTMRLIKDRSE